MPPPPSHPPTQRKNAPKNLSKIRFNWSFITQKKRCLKQIFCMNITPMFQPMPGVRTVRTENPNPNILDRSPVRHWKAEPRLEQETSDQNMWLCSYGFLSHRINVWCIYLHLIDYCGQCRRIYQSHGFLWVW